MVLVRAGPEWQRSKHHKVTQDSQGEDVHLRSLSLRLVPQAAQVQLQYRVWYDAGLMPSMSSLVITKLSRWQLDSLDILERLLPEPATTALGSSKPPARHRAAESER